MAREDLHFRLRIPLDLKQRIEAHADLNTRSMTAEIVSRLYESVNDESRARLASLALEELKKKVAEQEKEITKLRASQIGAVKALTRSEEAIEVLNRLVDAKEETKDAMRQNIAAMQHLLIRYEEAFASAADGDRSELDRLVELRKKESKEDRRAFLKVLRGEAEE